MHFLTKEHRIVYYLPVPAELPKALRVLPREGGASANQSRQPLPHDNRRGRTGPVQLDKRVDQIPSTRDDIINTAATF
jgi:hypothetical protein